MRQSPRHDVNLNIADFHTCFSIRSRSLPLWTELHCTLQYQEEFYSPYDREVYHVVDISMICRFKCDRVSHLTCHGLIGWPLRTDLRRDNVAGLYSHIVQRWPDSSSSDTSRVSTGNGDFPFAKIVSRSCLVPILRGFETYLALHERRGSPQLMMRFQSGPSSRVEISQAVSPTQWSTE